MIVSNIGGETLSLVNNQGRVTLSGRALFDKTSKKYLGKAEIITDSRRDKRYFSLLADDKPCDYRVENNKIVTYVNLENPPKEFKLIWLSDDRDYPNIFRSQVSYINKKGHKEISKITNNIKRYLWIYDIEGDDRNCNFEIHPIPPIDYNYYLEIIKVVGSKSEVIYKGFDVTQSHKVNVNFDLSILEYENFNLYLNWYNKEHNCVTEIFETEFIKQNEPDLNYQLPLVNVDNIYLNYYGKYNYSTYTDIDSRKTIISYNGLLEGNSIELIFDFKGTSPTKINCEGFRVNNRFIGNLELFHSHNGYSLPIDSSLFQGEPVESAILEMSYYYDGIKMNHFIDITKLYKR